MKKKYVEDDLSKCDDKIKLAKKLFNVEETIDKYAKDNSKFKKVLSGLGLDFNLFSNKVKKESLEANYQLNGITMDKIKKAKAELAKEVHNNPKRQQDFDELDAFFKMVGAMK